MQLWFACLYQLRSTSDQRHCLLGISSRTICLSCVQRAHQNTLENLPGLLAMQCLVGLRNPLFAAILGTIWNIGRVIYTYGYNTGDPNKRTPGFAISWLAYVVLIGATAYAGVSIAGLLR